MNDELQNSSHYIILPNRVITPVKGEQMSDDWLEKLAMRFIISLNATEGSSYILTCVAEFSVIFINIVLDSTLGRYAPYTDNVRGKGFIFTPNLDTHTA